MKLSCALPFVILVGCGSAPVEGHMPEAPVACSPHRVPWLKQGAHWHFEVTTVNGARHDTAAFSLDLGPAKQTNGYTLYPLTSLTQTDLWSSIGTNSCGDIVVSDGTTIYTVYTEATQAWSGVGFFASYDTSANVYSNAQLIPSMASATSAYGGNPLTAMGTVDGDASNCVSYNYYGTACGAGTWANVTMDLEYWDAKSGPVAWHTASPGHETRIERSDSVITQREPDSYERPSVWPWDTELTAEIGPLDAAPVKTAAPAAAALAQDWIGITLDAQRTVLLDWSGDAELELSAFSGDKLVGSIEGKDHAARLTLPAGPYKLGVHRKDSRNTEAIYTLNVITDTLKP